MGACTAAVAKANLILRGVSRECGAGGMRLYCRRLYCICSFYGCDCWRERICHFNIYNAGRKLRNWRSFLQVGRHLVGEESLRLI